MKKTTKYKKRIWEDRLLCVETTSDIVERYFKGNWDVKFRNEENGEETK